MKRLYKVVSVADKDFGILLDGKTVKTPDGHILKAPNAAIAQAMMAEWASQEKDVIPSSMIFTQFISTKLDRVIPQREEIEKGVLNYLDTDLICYRTDFPPDLAQRQQDAWNPWLAWFEKRFNSALQTTTDIAAIRQDQKAKDAVRAHVQGLDHDRFNMLQFVTSLSGSLVLALAFAEHEIEADVLFSAMRVEEQYKAGIYDEAKYGAEDLQIKRDAAIQEELAAATRFLNLLQIKN